MISFFEMITDYVIVKVNLPGSHNGSNTDVTTNDTVAEEQPW